MLKQQMSPHGDMETWRHAARGADTHTTIKNPTTQQTEGGRGGSGLKTQFEDDMLSYFYGRSASFYQSSIK